MSKLNVENTRNRLRLSTSSLVFLAAVAMAAGANAQVVQLTPATNGFMIDNSPGQTVEITSGTTAIMFPKGQEWITGAGNTWANALYITDENWGVAPGWGANNMTIGDSPFGGANPNAAVIQVDSGATLRFLGTQSLGWGPWFGMNNMIHAEGDVIFENNSANIVGTNLFAGNLTLLDGANIFMGESWGAPSEISFSSHTQISLGAGSLLYLRLPGTFTSTAGTLVSSDATGKLELAGGKLVLDGANTAASPFTGTLLLDSGSTLMVGDATHATAVLGDPNHTNGSGYALDVHGTIGGTAKLQGYGKIYGTVTNTGGIVQPGGSAGTMGTLTVSQYSQDATGMLQVEVTPTAASQLHVLGNAALNGSLKVTIDPGSYGTGVYNIVTVDGTMTGGFTSITTASSATGAIAAVTHSSHGYQVVTEVVAGSNATAPVVNGHIVSANRLDTQEFVDSLYDIVAVNGPKHGAVQQASLAHNVYAWLNPFGRMSSISRDQIGYHTSAAGVSGGIEARTPENATLGFAVSYAHENLRSKGASAAHMNIIDLALYGGLDLQYARVDGVAFYNTYDAATARNFGSNGVAKAAPSGYAYGGSAQVSKPLFHDLLTPFMRGTYARQHLAAATETGATVLDLKLNAINANTFTGDVGFMINPLYRIPECPTKLDITVAIEHDFSKLGETVTGEFPIGSGQGWDTFWKGDSENTLLARLNVVHPVTDQIELYGRVDGRFSLFQTAGEVSIGGRYRF
jgi:hypothetical protein